MRLQGRKNRVICLFVGFCFLKQLGGRLESSVMCLVNQEYEYISHQVKEILVCINSVEIKEDYFRSGVGVYTLDLSTQEAEKGELL